VPRSAPTLEGDELLRRQPARLREKENAEAAQSLRVERVERVDLEFLLQRPIAAGRRELGSNAPPSPQMIGSAVISASSGFPSSLGGRRSESAATKSR
jgi:hypothetical protein